MVGGTHYWRHWHAPDVENIITNGPPFPAPRYANERAVTKYHHMGPTSRMSPRRYA